MVYYYMFIFDFFPILSLLLFLGILAGWVRIGTRKVGNVESQIRVEGNIVIYIRVFSVEKFILKIQIHYHFRNLMKDKGQHSNLG